MVRFASVPVVSVLVLVATAAAARAQVLGPPEPTVRLEGRVEDQRGEGVVAARVVVRRSYDDPAPLLEATADGEGNFVLPRVPLRNGCLVTATAAGLCTTRVPVHGTTTPLLLRLHEAATVRGVLRDAAGLPIGGAGVQFAPWGDAVVGSHAHARTDARGRFELPGVPLGQGALFVMVPGRGMVRTRLVVRGDVACPIDLPGKNPIDLSLALDGVPQDRIGAVEAVVTPFEFGAWVPPGWPTVHFGTDGRATVSGVPPGTLRVSASAPGLRFLEPQFLNVRTGQSTLLLSARALPGAPSPCTIHLQDAGGAPAREVGFTIRGESGELVLEARTDAGGTARFESWAPIGTQLHLLLSPDRCAIENAHSLPAAIELAQRQFPRTAAFRLEATNEQTFRVVPAGSITGRVVSSDGTPARFTTIELDCVGEGGGRYSVSTRTATDGRGMYRIEGMPIGTRAWFVRCDARAGSGSTEPFPPPEPGGVLQLPDLQLAPPATVEGVVRDQNGAPEPGAHVLLTWNDPLEENSCCPRRWSADTDRQGRYRLVGVRPGHVVVTLETPADERFRLQQPASRIPVEPGTTHTLDLQEPHR